MWRKSKSMERERIYERIKRDFEESKKDAFYYRLHDLITKDKIFSKLSYILLNREQIGYFGNYTNLIKNFFIIPILILWKLFLIKFERLYYKKKYPTANTLQEIKNENFDYLFVLNTRDHIITALPVLESMDNKARSLIVTFKGVYAKYKSDFDNLKNAKIIFFEYELKNLSLGKYIGIIKEAKSKFRLLESQNLDSDLKRLIKIDKNFIKFHLTTELIQYYFFEKIFNNFDIKGAVSIVFTTAFEIAKEKNIPTFILQHGIGGKGHGHPYVCDYWFTFDDVSKKSLDEWLDHTVNVLAVGSPRFEYLKDWRSRLNREDFNRRLGIPVDARDVTYISVGSNRFENKDLFLALKELRQKLPDDVKLIIKLHPRENLKISNAKKEIKEIFSTRELKETVFIRKEIDFYEILANSDIVISTISTGMLESVAMDIPSLQINFTGRPYPPNLNLSSFGWKEPISDSEIMINEVLAILNDAKRRKEVIEKQRWLRDRVLKNFGRCGEVIAETIVNICEKDKEIKR